MGIKVNIPIGKKVKIKSQYDDNGELFDEIYIGKIANIFNGLDFDTQDNNKDSVAGLWIEKYFLNGKEQKIEKMETNYSKKINKSKK